jgi:hypothetical protein
MSHMLFRHPDLVRPEKFEVCRGTYIDPRVVDRDHLAPGHQR